MKKAKDYAEYILICEHDEDELMGATSRVITELVKEISTLIKSRNILKASALKSIILETDQKWKAVCNKIDREILKPVFMLYIKQELPELLELAGIER